MQYPVPQFTDVEDKIIGPLTLKQFGLIFGAGVIVFLGYSGSGKNGTVGIVFALLFGLPAIGLAFAEVNGRKLYNSFGYIFNFIVSEKRMIFHKETSFASSDLKLKNAELKSKTAGNVQKQETLESTQSRLHKVEELLKKEAEEESDVAKRIQG
jgi:hypothetical protein